MRYTDPDGRSGELAQNLNLLDVVKSSITSAGYNLAQYKNWAANASTNRRPDIMGVRKNGKIDQIEVMSKTDSYSTLQNRMIDNRSMMGARGGNINVVEP